MKNAHAPRPQVLRALEGMDLDLVQAHEDGFITFEQEAAEDAHLDARIARWEAERIEDEIDQCYYHAHDMCCWDHDRHIDWEEEDRLWEQEVREHDHAWAVMHLARTMVRMRPLV